ncbi:hypothetical protein HS088_TW13G01537 [Tripterygium wilfordii]|uniref:PHD-type domain-containing protein n=1 Tax=Tripterygium wilfordii TaxID=458696 RepID=A0A7J7CXN2_TRIWF|nr:uncharacterized protein LOC120011897 [Tripterygium wilfordii]XP_038718991.1 uncharacterized protein LOC120011897 [Tripterygium wilfordii]KAF5738636.1 hypothetical protein HS088_TW13G01537 [Tripterygium wilfordii]
MDERMRSGDPPGIVVKNRNSSGCLIVRKKGSDGVGGAVASGSRRSLQLKKEKKRPRLVLSGSGSSDELLVPPRRRVAPETIRVCNGLSVSEKGILEESQIGRKRDREEYSRLNEIGTNGEGQSERKNDRLDVFEFDEYDGIDVESVRRKCFNDVGAEVGGRKFLESMPIGRSGIQREYMTGSSGQYSEKRKNCYYERTSGFSQGDRVDRIRLSMDREEARRPTSLLHDKYLGDSDEPIRVQGKNGVLKVMVNKNKKVGRSLSNYDQLEAEGNWRGSKTNDTVNRNVMTHPSYSSESRSREKPGSFIRTQENQLNSRKSFSTRKTEEHDSSSEDSDTSLKPSSKNVQARNSTKRFLAAKNGVIHQDLKDDDMTPMLVSKNVESRNYKRRLSTKNDRGAHLESEASNMSLKVGSKKVEYCNMKKSAMTKYNKGADTDSEDSDTSPKMGPKSVEAHYSTRRLTSGGEKTPCSKLVPSKVEAGKVRRGSGTEKQKLREQIRAMLLNAGWTIDYRPRRNRDYLDAVYINPSGTAYWSIIKAYDALQNQLNEDDEEAKPTGDGSSFTPLSEEVLSQLTRKTRKKIEKEMKKKQQESSESENAEDVCVKKSASARHKGESMDSGSQEEKLNSFIKHGGKSSKSRVSENGRTSSHHFCDGAEIPFIESSSHQLQGQKSRKLGRCTLRIRNSNKGLNSETDGFIPYSGKRTLLSWLIDIGSVQLSQKVQYKNRRRTKVMLEGWITRDGIHCGCCSKILTVSKFEIHAGSKLRQPFQNIYLDSGMSLLQCQIDAWVKQEKSERIGFNPVDIDGDDPNDDTCGLCGDGGDLICCDGCPSTFHQICLDIQMLPPGDWYCPYCACKFCGKGSDDIGQENDSSVHALLSCTLCEKKYHQSCTLDIPLSVDSNSSFTYFCGQKCIELSEQIQKYLGVELEEGYSWSLIHRMDTGSDASSRELPQRVECNSKLAVALTVMEECFLPIIDRRSGINLLHNVLYNCGSNFNRLNYGGFYTAILERGDEIISAATIRFHGTQLTEMPFIGTRHIYRRQGMCRRLFCAIEAALRSLKVEKMIIPAISELTHTWTGVFGFTPLEDSLKQELRSMNVLVFPGIDMLQKLLQRENSEEDVSISAKQMEIIGKHFIPFVVDNKSDVDASVGHDSLECDDGHLRDAKVINDRVTAAYSDSQGPGVSLSNASEKSNSLDASHEPKIPVSLEGTFTDSESGDKVAESVLDGKCHPISVMSYNMEEMENKSILNSSIKFGTPSSKESGATVMVSDSQCQSVSLSDTPLVSSSMDASYEGGIPVSLEGAVSADSESGDKLAESASNKEGVISDASPRPGALEIKGQQVLLPHNGENAQSCEKDNAEDGHALHANVAKSHELTIPVLLDETLCADSKSGDKSSIYASSTEDKTFSDMSPHALEMKNEPALNSSVEDDAQDCNEGNMDDEPELNGFTAQQRLEIRQL